jgi:hypothetical protein
MAAATLEDSMRIVGIVVVALGILALVYGGFSYERDETALKLGPVEVQVERKHDVAVPVWAGVGAVIVGGLLIAFGGRRG